MIIKERENLIHSESTDFCEIFKNQLEIPPYQRPYSWNEEQLSDFLNDLYACSITTEKHYIGPMYFKNHPTKFNVVEITDGQQRITTTFLFFIGLKHVIDREFLYSNESRTIFERMIKDLNELLYSNEKSRLQLGTSDREAYDTIFQNYNVVFENYDDFKQNYGVGKTFLSSAKRLFNNYTRIIEFLLTLIEEEKKLFDLTNKNHKEFEVHVVKKFLYKVHFDFEELLTALIKQFEINKCMIVSGEADTSFKLFDTINDRGRPLDQVDKIKNFLFRNVYNYYKKTGDKKGHDSYEKIKSDWAEIQKTVDNDLEDYIRYYIIQSNYLKKFVRVKDLYNDIEDYIGKITLFKENSEEEEKHSQNYLYLSYKKSIELVENLKRFKDHYSFLIDPQNSFIENNIIKSNIFFASDYKIIKALLLKILIEYKNDEALSRYITVITNLAILYVSIFKGTKLDRLEVEIYNSLFKKTDALNQNISRIGERLFLSMQSINKDFVLHKSVLVSKISSLNNDKVAYYIQIKLNDYLNSKNAGDFYYPLVLNKNAKDSINKDHILPQSYSYDFKQKIQSYFTERNVSVPFSKTIQKEYIKNIGNVIPLKKTPNIYKSNEDPIDFFNQLEVKGLLVDDLLQNHNDWGIEDIIKRAERIAEMIVDKDVLTYDVEKARF